MKTTFTPITSLVNLDKKSGKMKTRYKVKGQNFPI